MATVSSTLTSTSTPSPIMRENWYHASAYGVTYSEQRQNYLGNHFSNQDPTSSHRDSSTPLPPSYVPPSLSQSSYTSYPAANGYEIKHNSDGQSISYCTWDTRSRQGGNGIPYSGSTIRGSIQNYQAAGIGQNLAMAGYDSTADVPCYYDPPFTEYNTPCYNPYHNASPEERQATDFSSNSYSNIGSQFELNEPQSFEWSPFLDPVFSQDLSTNVPYNSNSTAASQTSRENFLLPFNPNTSADRPVAPAVVAAGACVESSYHDVSKPITIPILRAGQVIMPTNATAWSAFAMTSLSIHPTTTSNISPGIASVETNRLDRPSRSNYPCYNPSPTTVCTNTLPHNATTSLGHPGNGTLSSIRAPREASSNPVFMPHSLNRAIFPSLASTDNINPIQLQAIDHSVHDASLDAIPAGTFSSNPSASVTEPDSAHSVSKCSWIGCSTTVKGKHRVSNMQNHVRYTHEKPAPPICEICGMKFKKNESLKRHLKNIHQYKPPDVVRTVRKRRADGTLFSTYQQVHDYVNGRVLGLA